MPGKAAAGGADGLRDRDGVVEQSVAVSLVVVLGRRRLAEAKPDRGVRREEAVEERGELGVLDRPQELAKLRLEPLDRDARPLGEVGRLELAVAGGTDRLDGDLGPVLGVDARSGR